LSIANLASFIAGFGKDNQQFYPKCRFSLGEEYRELVCKIQEEKHHSQSLPLLERANHFDSSMLHFEKKSFKSKIP